MDDVFGVDFVMASDSLIAAIFITDR